MAARIVLSFTTTSNGATSATVTVTMTYYGNGVSYEGDASLNKCTITIGTQTQTFYHSFTKSTSAQTMGSASFTITKTQRAQTVTASGKMVNESQDANNLTASVDISVSAKTSYSVTYYANGGTGAPSAQTKWYNETLTLSTTTPTRTGYTFSGWNTNASGTGTNYSAGASYTTNAALSLYAKWTPITYTVSFNANGGVNTPSPQTKTHGVDLTITSDTPTRTGFNFVGWATSSEGTVAYSPNGTYSVNADITLYAVWVTAYQAPQILNAKAVRCNSAGVELLSGSYIKVSFDWLSGVGADGTINPSTITVSGGMSYSDNFTSASGSFMQIVGFALGSTNIAVINITDTTESVSTRYSLLFPKGGLAVHINRTERGIRFFGIADDDDDGVILDDLIFDVDSENENDPLVSAVNDLGWEMNYRNKKSKTDDITGLIDTSTNENGSIPQNGVPATNSTFTRTQLIAVSEGTYTFKTIPPTGSNTIRIHGYDKDGVWSKQITYFTVSGTAQVVKTFSVTSDLYYVRLSYPKASIDSTGLFRGTV